MLFLPVVLIPLFFLKESIHAIAQLPQQQRIVQNLINELNHFTVFHGMICSCIGRALPTRLLLAMERFEVTTAIDYATT